MSENELEKEVESPEDVLDIEDTDTTDWKAEAQKAQELARKNAGIAKRNATRLEKLKGMKVEAPVEKKAEKKEGFDNADKAYLRAAGIKSNEFPLAQKYIDAGKTIDDILDEESVVGKLFQAELKEGRETKETKEAIPSGSKRSVPASRDTVEYHIANNTPVMKIDDVEVRRKVVNARLKKEQLSSRFTDTPVV